MFGRVSGSILASVGQWGIYDLSAWTVSGGQVIDITPTRLRPL
ncbi:hypothetical protein HMPREF3198_02124 [Winkia neuii]|nr:hypothetical protein [Winkia neuii]KWZ72032.1 hypothetical protein HMPREF3198_02124 [Winkia neuii]MDK8100001.1 hypothetical protein [Winkia neuii]